MVLHTTEGLGGRRMGGGHPVGFSPLKGRTPNRFFFFIRFDVHHTFVFS